ncbi:LysR family transcriptional regulator [Sagittula sp. NFXS13]|uniref:LysR family hydrogen peroxide-inducible transcriptional activator n=1 Tax=Sagittula marina TaxID=943940 RepID=A0A7W6DSK9_9RHOB|nr:hydrogen peroxide-inducible genes activator [Sagittula marina]MBB3985935.1 LysR family hydrogen peroxide-inducible transcriptional activator [Sagittula marina]
MRNITLKQMRYFQALARHGHFGHAASACAISQPALSVQIRDLEAELGQPLVERGPRQVRLTAFGESFLARVTDILKQVDDLGDFARSARGAMMQRLRLGIIPTIAPYLLPRLIGHITAEFPGLDLHVRETLTPRLITELIDGRIDAALLALPISEPSLTEVPLFEESFVLVRPADEADRPIPDAQALAEMRLLLLEEGHCFRDQALSFCQTGRNMPRDGLDGSSLTTLVQMVGVGLGVTLIPEMAVRVETGSAPVSVARFAEPQPKRMIGMVWRNSSPLADQFYRISEVAKDVGLTA